MTRNTAEMIKVCEHILKVVKEKSKEEANPLLTRIQFVIQEIQTHFLAVSTLKEDLQQQKNHWSILYRDGDVLDEMTTLLNNTTPVYIQSEVEYIKHSLVEFTSEVVHAYGLRDSLYIITPKFQELSGLW